MPPVQPGHPILNVFMNNRDHRKITVVDGRVGFTGGYNLAEEYFNAPTLTASGRTASGWRATPCAA